MTHPSEYALLAAGAYDDIRFLQENKSPVPSGWKELNEFAVSGSGGASNFGGSGFSAKVYRKGGSGGEIVISYAGTEFALSLGALNDWAKGNSPLAEGAKSEQALQAAQLYQRVKAVHGDNITFTGHSLGGGLASIMAVWYDRPAKVFAPAL